MENDDIYDIFLDCEPVADNGGSPVDCDPRLSGAPYTREQLAVINEERRLWSLVDTDNEEGPAVVLGAHVVNVLAWYVTVKPAPATVDA